MQSEKNKCLFRQMIKLHKDERGMSLVEVIIAMTILGLVAVPVLHSLTTSMVYNKKARNRQEMTLTAESIMETFKGYDLDSLKTRFSAGGGGVEGITLATPGETEYNSDPDTGTGFHYIYDSSMLSDPTAVGGIYTFSINDMKAENGQFYDVTITATPNSVEKIMVQDNMETTRDAIYKGDRSFDTSALQKAKDDFKNNRQSELGTYFASSYSDAVFKEGGNVFHVKDEINKVFEPSAGSFYVGNYIKLHEKKLEFVITNNGSDEYVVTPKMSYSYYMEGYPYYVREEPASIPDDEYDPLNPTPPPSDPNTIVEHSPDSTIRYPESGVLNFDIDLTSAYPDGYIYKNPVTAQLDRLFIYYYPQYNLDPGCDTIEVNINSSVGIANLQCYILKQRAADINENQMKIKESHYKANVKINNSGSGSVVLFHNFDDNIADGSSPPAPGISGASKVVSYTELVPGGDMTELTSEFSELEALSYKLELVVTQNGREITKLESSMNEKIK